MLGAEAFNPWCPMGGAPAEASTKAPITHETLGRSRSRHSCGRCVLILAHLLEYLRGKPVTTPTSANAIRYIPKKP
ncbi:hypothetical protein MRX96_015111 [Rhipicephalus microplus]